MNRLQGSAGALHHLPFKVVVFSLLWEHNACFWEAIGNQLAIRDSQGLPKPFLCPKNTAYSCRSYFGVRQQSASSRWKELRLHKQQPALDPLGNRGQGHTPSQLCWHQVTGSQCWHQEKLTLGKPALLFCLYFVLKFKTDLEKVEREKIFRTSQEQWGTTLILALRRQREADLCQFQASLIYIESQVIQNYIERPCLKKQDKQT